MHKKISDISTKIAISGILALILIVMINPLYGALTTALALSSSTANPEINPYENKSSPTITGPYTYGPSDTTKTSSNNATGSPTVKFLTDAEVSNLNGTFIITLSDINKHGYASDLKTATDGNITYVAWLGKVNQTSHLLLSLSRNQGLNYTSPVELSPNNTGDVSNVQIFAGNNTVTLVWQSTNLATGTSAIYGSRSYDGNHFTTLKLSSGNTTATDPVISDNISVFWIQQENCGGGGGGPSQGDQTSAIQGNMTINNGGLNQTSQFGQLPPEMPGGGVVCIHYWRTG
jgi:hypothetical protein